MSDHRFPELTQKQISALKEYGKVETFDADTPIFELGDLKYDFFFVLKGATPCTEWLNGLVATNEKGFICTGAGISENDLYQCDIFENGNLNR